MRIQHNIMAMNSYRNYTNNANSLSKNLEKLSSGYKINRAGDDAAGLAISEKMRAQIQGLNAAQKNVKDGISLVKTGEGAMQEIQDMLSRMKYLATQSANGTYDNEVDRKALQDEVDSLKEEINRIADSANFNGIYLLKGAVSDDPSDVTKTGTYTAPSTDPTTQAVYNVGSISTSDLQKLGTSASLSISVTGSTVSSIKFVAATGQNGEDATVAASLDDGVLTITIRTAGTGGGSEKDFDAAYASDAALMKAINDAIKNAGVNDVTISGTLKTSELKSGGGATLTAGALFTVSVTPGTESVPGVDIETDYGILGLGNISASVAKLLATGTNAVTLDFDTATNTLTVTIGGVAFTASVTAAASALGSSITLTATSGEKITLNLASGQTKIGTDATQDITGAIGTVTVKEQNGGGSQVITLQIGDTGDDFNQMKVIIGDMHTSSMGSYTRASDGTYTLTGTMSIASISIASYDSAHTALDVIKNAINYVSAVRGQLGAIQNRLEHTANNLSVMAENIQDAESTIRDTDVADEMMGYVKNNILIQSAQAMLAQANQVPQGVLQLLG